MLATSSGTGAASNATLTEVRDRLPLAPSGSVPGLAAEGLLVRPIPSGPQTITASTSIVFGVDHPPVNAALIVGGSAVSAGNPVPVQGVTPRRSPNGAITPAVAGILVAGTAALLRLKVWYLGNIARYLLLFDAPNVGAASDANLVEGSGYDLPTSTREREIAFTYGLSFSSGIVWAVSESPTTYQVSTRTAIVTGQWA